MDYKQKILEFIRMNGPSLPMKVAKSLGLDTIIASAYMAELVSKKSLCVSTLKIGGSPLYYLPNSEYMLEKFSEHLSSKEKEAFSFLKSERVAKDSELTPQLRVAMGFLKDFAKPIVVEGPDGVDEKYWKWFSIKNEEVSSIIKQKYYPEKLQEPKETQGGNESQTKNQKADEAKTEPEKPKPAEKITLAPEKKAEQKISISETKHKEQDHEKQKTLIENNSNANNNSGNNGEVSNNYNNSTNSNNSNREDGKNTSKANESKTGKSPGKYSESTKSQTERITTPTKSKKSPKSQEVDLTPFDGIELSSLPKEIELNIRKGKIFLLDERQKEKLASALLEKGFEFELGFQDKKAKEIFGFARLSSAKKIRFFVSLLKGKRISDKDLALAFLKSSSYSLPLLVLYTGNLTKTAQEILSKTNIEIIKV